MRPKCSLLILIASAIENWVVRLDDAIILIIIYQHRLD